MKATLKATSSRAARKALRRMRLLLRKSIYIYMHLLFVCSQCSVEEQLLTVIYNVLLLAVQVLSNHTR